MADGKQDDPYNQAVELIAAGEPRRAAEVLEKHRGGGGGGCGPRDVAADRLLAIAYFMCEEYALANKLLEKLALGAPEPDASRVLRELSAANVRAGLPEPSTRDQEFVRRVVLAPPPVRDADLPPSPVPSPPTLRRALERSIGEGAGAFADVVWRGLRPLATMLREENEGIWTNWDEKPRVIGLAMLSSMRDQLEKRNLKDSYPLGSLTAFQLPGLVRPEAAAAYRTPDGSWNDPNNPREGSANVRFPRNVDAAHAIPEVEPRLQMPNPAEISEELLARGSRDMQEVPFLNLLSAAWIQFMVHDWVSHRSYSPDDNERAHTIDLPVPPKHPAAIYHQRRLRVGKTMPDPTRTTADGDSPPTTINEVTSWWDASQLYGSDGETTRRLRNLQDGKLRLDDDRWLPRENGAELAGFTRNWWVGLSMLTTLFVKEHNAICDMLKSHHPTWDDERLFHTARLVNAAVLAKLHTVEWTPAILPNPTLTTAMETNWYGLVERTLFRKQRKTRRRIKIKNGVLGGLVGNAATKHGVPYGLTEEFVEVYRLHELLPDQFEIHDLDSAAARPKQVSLPETRGKAAPDLMRQHGLASLLYSFGIQSPGKIVLHNYPNSMRQLSVTGAPLMDVAATDILRSRERGVPRYNEFRRQLGLRPITRFDDLTSDQKDVEALKRIYGHVDEIDMHVGTRAEERRPRGFGFGETLFQIFIVNASRRLEADHFFSEGYNADNYTEEGLAWIERATFKAVLLRHHPELAATGLAQVDNAFEPWDTGTELDPERHPLRSITRSSWLQRLGDGSITSIQATRSALTMLCDRADDFSSRVRAAASGVSVRDLGERAVWGVRRRVWDALLLVKFVANELDSIPAPPAQIARIDYVPLRSVEPSIPIDRITVADHVPEDEADAFRLGFYKVQMKFADVFGPQQPGLPSVGNDSVVNLRRAFGPVKRFFVSPPVRPEPLQGPVADLGALAVAGPYWGYLVATGNDTWEWDLRELGRFEHQPGLRNLGVRVRFERDASRRKPEATLIECELGTVRRNDATWSLAVQLALCAITTHVSLVRHFNAIHLAFGAKFAQATRNRLPTGHPLLRLVWPHIHDTQYSNELVTLGQMSPNGDFPSIFSFTHGGLCELFEHSYQRLQLKSFDAERDATTRGEAGRGLDTPGLDEVMRIWNVLHTHATRYIHAYYAADEALAGDAAVRAWLEEMQVHMPNGIPLNIGSVTRAELSRFITVLLNVVIVEHALRDASPWNYILWTDRAPIRVYADGRREPIDVYQRLVNAYMLFQLPRTLLTKDFSYLALDERGRRLFRDFRQSLFKLQSTLVDNPRPPWRLYPGELNANMNA